ncbi:MAG: hypothetical protein M1272_04330 [Firmicutes bacterium]|nr:hypothetical protein [Bacillota bacterium]
MEALGLWALILLRLGVLSGERIAFHGLGRQRNALATTAVAYGGAAALLWLSAWATGQGYWVGQAFWPGAVYAVSFALYTAALAEGPVSLVSAFANATAVLLFFVTPRWDVQSLLAIGLFGLGAALLVPWGRRPSKALAWMLLSDAALAVGRLLDVHNQGVASLPYAASLFTAVLLWLAVPMTLYQRWGDVVRMVRERPGWGSIAAVSNGLAYLTVLELLRRIPATLVEAMSAWAGVIATVAGVVGFREGDGLRKVGSATLMTLGIVILLFSQSGRIG